LRVLYTFRYREPSKPLFHQKMSPNELRSCTR
jgi:hypothetical protein